MTLLRSRPIARQSAKAAEREKDLASVKVTVLARSGYRCEGCETNTQRLDLAHLMGRGQRRVGAPWCDHPALLAVLCHASFGRLGCHEKFDRYLDAKLRARLLWAAYHRLVAVVLSAPPPVSRYQDPELLIAQLVRGA